MSGIKSIGLYISILMVLAAYLKQVIPKSKMMFLMKTIISAFILFSILNGILHFDFSSISALFNAEISRDEAIWNESIELMEKGLKKEFQRFLDETEADAEVVAVMIAGDQDQYSVQKVILSGKDAERARNLLAGRYQIGIAYFEVKNE